MVKESSSIMPTSRRKTGANYAQDFERDLRMGETESLEILLADKQQRDVVDGHADAG